jgi:hypothetical protein
MSRADEVRALERQLDQAALDYSSAHARWFQLAAGGARAGVDEAWDEVIEARKRHQEAAWKFCQRAPVTAAARKRAQRERAGAGSAA